MDHPYTITIELDPELTTVIGAQEITLAVEEFQPIDRAAYQWEAGWSCFDDETEYFVSMAGIVYLQPDNVVVGIAPEIKKAADVMEASYADN